MTFLRRTLPDYTPPLVCIFGGIGLVTLLVWGAVTLDRQVRDATSCVSETVQLIDAGVQAMWAQTRAVERYLCTNEGCE